MSLSPGSHVRRDQLHVAVHRVVLVQPGRTSKSWKNDNAIMLCVHGGGVEKEEYICDISLKKEREEGNPWPTGPSVGSESRPDRSAHRSRPRGRGPDSDSDRNKIHALPPSLPLSLSSRLAPAPPAFQPRARVSGDPPRPRAARLAAAARLPLPPACPPRRSEDPFDPAQRPALPRTPPRQTLTLAPRATAPRAIACGDLWEDNCLVADTLSA
ncbi:hypothetical protein ZWY2020_045699 [Hordeum vulgare]|nr:hypothetical protein ZWY2020_045699 [Hordeum vulgare]